MDLKQHTPLTLFWVHNTAAVIVTVYFHFYTMHGFVLHYMLCALIPLYNDTVYDNLCVILPCQLWFKCLAPTWGPYKKWSRLDERSTEQAEVFIEKGPSEDQGRNIYAVIKGHWKGMFQINTHLQYARTTATAVLQWSTRSEINDAALLENMNQSISDFPKSLLSLWPSPARHLHRFYTIHCKEEICIITEMRIPQTHACSAWRTPPQRNTDHCCCHDGPCQSHPEGEGSASHIAQVLLLGATVTAAITAQLLQAAPQQWQTSPIFQNDKWGA